MSSNNYMTVGSLSFGRAFEHVKLAFLKPDYKQLPFPKGGVNSPEEYKAWRDRDLTRKQRWQNEAESRMFARLAEMSKLGFVTKAVVGEWMFGDEPKLPNGYRCMCAASLELYITVVQWFKSGAASTFLACTLTYEEWLKNMTALRAIQDPIADMARKLSCAVEYSTTTKPEPVWWMPDGSKVTNAKNFKDAIENNIAEALLKRMSMGLDAPADQNAP